MDGPYLIKLLLLAKLFKNKKEFFECLHVPVYFLDTSLPEDSSEDQGLTNDLYGGDARNRLCQEVILSFAGVAILRALGHRMVQACHMNEGHSTLVASGFRSSEA